MTKFSVQIPLLMNVNIAVEGKTRDEAVEFIKTALVNGDIDVVASINIDCPVDMELLHFDHKFSVMHNDMRAAIMLDEDGGHG